MLIFCELEGEIVQASLALSLSLSLSLSRSLTHGLNKCVPTNKLHLVMCYLVILTNHAVCPLFRPGFKLLAENISWPAQDITVLVYV